MLVQTPADEPQPWPLVAQAVVRAHTALVEANARTEALGTYVPARRRFFVFPQAERIVPAGRGWRLGVFLIDEQGALYAAGATTRAKKADRFGYSSDSARRRDGLRFAAFRGGFEVGETVNFDCTLLVDADGRPQVGASGSGPLVLDGGSARVRWSMTLPGASTRPFTEYLEEQVDLLLHPVQGA